MVSFAFLFLISYNSVSSSILALDSDDDGEGMEHFPKSSFPPQALSTKSTTVADSRKAEMFKEIFIFSTESLNASASNSARVSAENVATGSSVPRHEAGGLLKPRHSTGRKLSGSESIKNDVPSMRPSFVISMFESTDAITKARRRSSVSSGRSSYVFMAPTTISAAAISLEDKNQETVNTSGLPSPLVAKRRNSVKHPKIMTRSAEILAQHRPIVYDTPPDSPTKTLKSLLDEDTLSGLRVVSISDEDLTDNESSPRRSLHKRRASRSNSYSDTNRSGGVLDAITFDRDSSTSPSSLSKYQRIKDLLKVAEESGDSGTENVETNQHYKSSKHRHRRARSKNSNDDGGNGNGEVTYLPLKGGDGENNTSDKTRSSSLLQLRSQGHSCSNFGSTDSLASGAGSTRSSQSSLDAVHKIVQFNLAPTDSQEPEEQIQLAIPLAKDYMQTSSPNTRRIRSARQRRSTFTSTLSQFGTYIIDFETLKSPASDGSTGTPTTPGGGVISGTNSLSGSTNLLSIENAGSSNSPSITNIHTKSLRAKVIETMALGGFTAGGSTFGGGRRGGEGRNSKLSLNIERSNRTANIDFSTTPTTAVPHSGNRSDPATAVSSPKTSSSAAAVPSLSIHIMKSSINDSIAAQQFQIKSPSPVSPIDGKKLLPSSKLHQLKKDINTMIKVGAFKAPAGRAMGNSSSGSGSGSGGRAMDFGLSVSIPSSPQMALTSPVHPSPLRKAL